MDYEDKPTYSAKEVAKILDISYKTLTRLINTGRIKAIKIGTQYRITKQELERILEEGSK